MVKWSMGPVHVEADGSFRIDAGTTIIVQGELSGRDLRSFGNIFRCPSGEFAVNGALEFNVDGPIGTVEKESI